MQATFSSNIRTTVVLTLLISVGLSFGIPSYASSVCESGLSIISVLNDGKLIKLDDGSLWEVDDADTVDSELWLTTEDVVICGDKITDVDEEETVEATKIK
jgi:hypothetical protein